MESKQRILLIQFTTVVVALAASMAMAAPELLPAPKKNRTFVVMLDAGHGGDDLGAHSLVGYAEKDLALNLVKSVSKALVPMAKRRAIDLQTRLTRDSDVFVSLADRVDLANATDVDIFVSVHANHSPSKKVSGFEVYFASDRGTDAAAESLARKENGMGPWQAGASPVDAMLAELRLSKHLADSSDFAEIVYGTVSGAMKRQKGRGVRQGPFKVISGTDMPAVLLEVGYLSNEKESEQLDDAAYRSRLADAIARGILEYVVTRVPHR